MPKTSSKRSVSSGASSKRRRKSVMTKSMSVPQILRAVAKPIQTVHRTVGDVSFNGASGWNSGGNSLVFAFSQTQAYFSINGGAYANFGSPFDNAAGFLNVYDMYRCKKIWMDIYPSTSPPGPNQAATYAPIMVYCTPDYTDASLISTANQALAYGDVKVFQMNADAKESGATKYRLVIDKPSCNVGVDSINTGITTNTMNARAPWLYCSNTTAEFGFAKSSVIVLSLPMLLCCILR